MADEKRVNVVIDGDASGLQQEINRVSTGAREAFKDIGLDEMLGRAADKFEKRIEQFGYVMKEIEQERERTTTSHTERLKKVTNEAGRVQAEKEYVEKIASLDRTTEGLRKTMENFNKRFAAGQVDESGNALEKAPPPAPQNQEDYGSAENTRTNNGGGLLGRIIGSNGRINLGNLFNAKNLTGAAEGEGAAAAGEGGGMSAGAGLLAAAAALLGIKAWKAGAEDLRADNRLAAMGAGRDAFLYDNGTDYGDFSSLGVDRTDAKKRMADVLKSAVGLGLDAANSDDFRNQLFQRTLNRTRFATAYGIDDSTLGGFDQFQRSGIKDPTSTIAEFMVQNRASISNDNGMIIGPLMNEKLGQVVQLLEWQKQHGESVDQRVAFGMIEAGRQFGGQFADDRAADRLQTVGQGLTSSSGLASSVIMSTLLQRYGSLSKAIGARESLMSNKDDLQAVMSALTQTMGNGEFAKLELAKEGFGSQVDINRMLNGRGFATMGNAIGATNNVPDLAKRMDEVMKNIADRAKNLVLNTDALQIKATNVSIVSGRVMNQVVGNEAGVITDNPTK